MQAKERLSFNVEWFQEDAGLMRNYLLTFFPHDKSVEMVSFLLTYNIESDLSQRLFTFFQFDTAKNKIFLRRCAVNDLTEKHFYIGAKLNIFGRIVVVKAYEDEYTRNKMTSQRQKWDWISIFTSFQFASWTNVFEKSFNFRAFAMIPPKHLPKLSEIFKILCDNGFTISNCAMYEMSRQQSGDLIDKLQLCISDIFSCGPSVALVLTGSDAVRRLKLLIAGEIICLMLSYIYNCLCIFCVFQRELKFIELFFIIVPFSFFYIFRSWETNNWKMPRYYFRKWGTDWYSNMPRLAWRCSKGNWFCPKLLNINFCLLPQKHFNILFIRLSKMCEFFFAPKTFDGDKLCLAKSFENSTLCLIKPHAMLEGKCGEILCQITENGLVIKAMKMFNLQRQNCEEFYEVYKGVTRDYLVRGNRTKTNNLNF